MLNNLGFILKNYLAIINNQIQRNETLEKDKILFKAIKEENNYIKSNHKFLAHFILEKSISNPKK